MQAHSALFSLANFSKKTAKFKGVKRNLQFMFDFQSLPKVALVLEFGQITFDGVVDQVMSERLERHV